MRGWRDHARVSRAQLRAAPKHGALACHASSTAVSYTREGVTTGVLRVPAQQPADRRKGLGGARERTSSSVLCFRAASGIQLAGRLLVAGCPGRVVVVVVVVAALIGCSRSRVICAFLVTCFALATFRGEVQGASKPRVFVSCSETISRCRHFLAGYLLFASLYA